MTNIDADQTESQAGQPSNVQILEALKGSGYLFEHEVATAISDLGYHVETSWAFMDSEEQKSREIDVRAIREFYRDDAAKTQVFSELLIECKDAASPFVFLQREKNKRELNPDPREYTFPHNTFNVPVGTNSHTTVAAFQLLGLSNRHYYYRERLKATQFAKIVRKGGNWQANHDGVYDALILPLAKAVQKSRSTYAAYGGRDTWATIWLRFPIVVLRDHLFAYDLSEDVPQLQKSNRVSFLRHIESDALKGHFLTDFVTQAGLKHFINEEIFGFVDGLVELARSNRELLVAKDWSGPKYEFDR